MTWRTNLALLMAVLFTGLLIATSNRYGTSSRIAGKQEHRVMPVNPQTITVLHIDHEGRSFSLERSGATWKLTQPVRGAASDTIVQQLLDNITTLLWTSRLENEASLNEDVAENRDHGFSSPSARFLLVSGDGATNALVFGKATGMLDRYYVQSSLHEEILVADGKLINLIPESTMDFRDRKLLPFIPSAISRVEIESSTGELQLSRVNSREWILDRPVRARAAELPIRFWLENFYRFRIQSFIADSLAAAPLYGLDQPVITISFSSEDHEPQVLMIGRETETEGEGFYAAFSGHEQVFTIDRDVMSWSAISPDDFRDRRVLPFPASDISAIKISEGEQGLMLKRSTAGIWQVESPLRFDAHQPAVAQLLRAFENENVIRFARPDQQETIHNGIARAQRSITFTAMRGSGSPESAVIHLGDQLDADRFHAGLGTTKEPVEISRALAGYFSARTLRYRNPVVFELDTASITRIDQHLTDRTITLLNSNGYYRPQQHGLIPDTDAIARTVAACSRLTANELITDDARDLSLYGIGTDSRKLVFGLATEGINRVLLIGRKTPDGDIFAMRQGYDLIFALSQEMVDTLMIPLANPISIEEPAAPAPSTP